MRILRSVLRSPFAAALLASLLTAMVFGGGVADAFNVPNNSVTSAKVVDNSLNNRDLAIGQRTFPVRHRSGDVANRVFATVNGLQFRVSCTAGVEQLQVRKTSAVDSEISAISFDASVPNGDIEQNFYDFFGRNQVFSIGPTSPRTPTERQYTVQYVAANDNNVTAHLVTEDIVGPNNCVVGGYIVA